MPEVLKSHDFWEPIRKFQDPKVYEDFDMAVKAYIQIDITNYLIKNMSHFVRENGDLTKLLSFVQKWNLNSIVIHEYHVHQIGFSLKSFSTLYELEKELWSRLSKEQQAWAVEQLCRNYRSDLEIIIAKHLTRHKNKPIPSILGQSARFTQLMTKAKSLNLRSKILKEKEQEKPSFFKKIRQFISQLKVIS